MVYTSGHDFPNKCHSLKESALFLQIHSGKSKKILVNLNLCLTDLSKLNSNSTLLTTKSYIIPWGYRVSQFLFLGSWFLYRSWFLVPVPFLVLGSGTVLGSWFLVPGSGTVLGS